MTTRRDVVQAGLASMVAAAVNGLAVAWSAMPVYRMEGQGEPILLIAGYSCDLTVWDVLAPLLVENGFRVIRFNNLGVGRAVQCSPSEVTIAGMAGYTDDLLSSLNLPFIHVVGHSMGGQIAQELVLASPARVRSLTLLSSWGNPSERLSALLVEISRLAAVISPEEWQRNLLPWVLSDSVYALPGAIEQVAQANVRNSDRLSSALLQAQAAAIAASGTLDRLSKVRTPTLVAVGEQDILTPPAYSRQLSEATTGSIFELLPGGHGLIVEAAPQLAKRLVSFFKAS